MYIFRDNVNLWESVNIYSIQGNVDWQKPHFSFLVRQVGWLKNPKKFPELVVGWFQPIWQKICSSNMGILFPKFRGENQKIFELPPPRQSLEWQPSAWFLLIGQNHRDPDFMAYNNPIFNWVVWNHHLAEGLIQFFFLSLGCSVLLHQLLTCSPWRVVGELIVGVLFGKKNGRFLFQMGNWKTWIEFWIYIYVECSWNESIKSKMLFFWGEGFMWTKCGLLCKHDVKRSRYRAGRAGEDVHM